MSQINAIRVKGFESTRIGKQTRESFWELRKPTEVYNPIEKPRNCANMRIVSILPTAHFMVHPMWLATMTLRKQLPVY